MARLVGKALSYQLDFIRSNAKYTALVAGLGSGKTSALIYKVLDKLSKYPKITIGIYEPTHDLIRQILHPRLEEIFQGSGILYKLNKSEGMMQIYMPQGMCKIIFRSMNDPARIIGYEHEFAFLDEVDTLPKNKAMDIWVRVLARNRKKFHEPNGLIGVNTCDITTTPEGKNFVYSLWVKEHSDNPDYALLKGLTVLNYHLPPDYVESLKRTYPPQLIKAYLEGEFVNLVGNTVYDSYDRDLNDTNLIMNDFPITNTVRVGLDFNVGRMAATIIMKNEAGDVFVVDEIHHVMDTPAMIQIIQSKFKDRRVEIFPDASGGSRKSMDASKSDIRLLRDAGFRINAPRKNPPIRERVVSVNSLFCNSMGERKLFVNQSTCPHLVEQLEFQAYDDNSMPIKNSDEDILDSLGYCVNRINGLARPTTTIARMRMGI